LSRLRRRSRNGPRASGGDLRASQAKQPARVAFEYQRLGVRVDWRAVDERAALGVRQKGPVDRKHQPFDPDRLDRALQGAVRESAAGGEIEIPAQRFGE